MKRSAFLTTCGALAVAGLLNLGAAQAATGPCFLVMPYQGAAPTCDSAQRGSPAPEALAPSPACPMTGNGGTGCVNRQALGQALGSMAEGGMQIATAVMRALAGEANRLLASEPEM